MPVEAGVRPLVVGMLIWAGVGLLARASRLAIRMTGRPVARIGALLGLTLVGAAFGAFTAITFGGQVGIALGIAVAYLRGSASWPSHVSRTGIDVEALKERFIPNQTIETSKETLEWLRNGCRQERLLARERVLTARAEMADELAVLEASGRAAVDIPAKIEAQPGQGRGGRRRRRVPRAQGPAAGLPGWAGRAVCGAPPPLPKAMLPDEIEKTLRKLGDDGDRVRGTLERDFADYAKKAAGIGAQPAHDRSSWRPPAAPQTGVRPGRQLAVLAGQGGLRAAPRRRCGRGVEPSAREAPAEAIAPSTTALADRPRRAGRGRPVDRHDRGVDSRPRASGGMADAPALGAGAA